MRWDSVAKHRSEYFIVLQFQLNRGKQSHWKAINSHWWPSYWRWTSRLHNSEEKDVLANVIQNIWIRKKLACLPNHVLAACLSAMLRVLLLKRYIVSDIKSSKLKNKSNNIMCIAHTGLIGAAWYMFWPHLLLSAEHVNMGTWALPKCEKICRWRPRDRHLCVFCLFVFGGWCYLGKMEQIKSREVRRDLCHLSGNCTLLPPSPLNRFVSKDNRR